jgi:hypothetical protein
VGTDYAVGPEYRNGSPCTAGKEFVSVLVRYLCSVVFGSLSTFILSYTKTRKFPEVSDIDPSFGLQPSPISDLPKMAVAVRYEKPHRPTRIEVRSDTEDSQETTSLNGGGRPQLSANQHKIEDFLGHFGDDIEIPSEQLNERSTAEKEVYQPDARSFSQGEPKGKRRPHRPKRYYADERPEESINSTNGCDDRGVSDGSSLESIKKYGAVEGTTVTLKPNHIYQQRKEKMDRHFQPQAPERYEDLAEQSQDSPTENPSSHSSPIRKSKRFFWRSTDAALKKAIMGPKHHIILQTVVVKEVP